MCKACQEFENYIIEAEGYAYICRCGHIAGWDADDIDDWHQIYRLGIVARCHFCQRSGDYMLRQEHWQLVRPFLLIGAL